MAGKIYLFCIMLLCLQITGFSGESIKKDVESLYKEAEEYLSNGSIIEASVSFENAVNIDPDIFFLMSGKGVFEKLLKNPDDGAGQYVEKMCNSLISNGIKEDFFVYYYLGWSLLNQDKKDEAIKNLEKSKKIMIKKDLDPDIVEELLKKSDKIISD